MKVIFKIFFCIFIVSSCTQRTAPISYKGHLFFGKYKPVDVSNSPAFKKSKRAKKTAVGRDVVVVKDGDNLYNIARAHKISIREIIDANDLKPPYTLHPGDRLKVPGMRKTYIVVKGDNLTHIARRYNVSVTELAKVNNLDREHRVRIGEALVLPYGVKGKSQTRTIKKVIKTSMAKIKNTSFIWPIKGVIIQDFGDKKDGVNADGINIAAEYDATIKAAGAGKVVYVGSELRGYGNLIILKHSGNWLTAYAHSNNVYVTKGQKVAQGETIATVGKSGNVSEPQLHFGLRKGKKAVDPKKYLR
jgi:murein DD-endopeptidase MepM/ murein hydrolase activator NlpD